MVWMYYSRRPKALYVLLVLNILVFLYTLMLPYREKLVLIYTFGVLPALIGDITSAYRLVTSMFLHADILHLFFNMYALFLLGRDCEILYGSGRFLFLYFLSGIFAGILHSAYVIAFTPQQIMVPAIGASGAIFGVMASYALFFPHRKLFVFLGLIPIAAPAIIVIAGLALLQILYALVIPFSSIAYVAHIGGFIAGFIVSMIYKARMGSYEYV